VHDRPAKRREFLVGTAAALAVAPLASGCGGWRASSAPQPPRPAAPLAILILGGTGFIGPHQVQYAVSRGHRVTVFNRGRRQTLLPAGVEHLTGDRNGDLAALQGRRWDVVIDNPTTLPRWVRSAGEILAGHTGQYIFISTISVYAALAGPGLDESTPVARYTGPDAFAESTVTPELYGPLKAICEQEAERWFPGRTTVIRPGLIVGPGDETDRFTYWPVRIARGGEILAPGDGRDPVQIIDARDLGAWTIRMAEQRAFGTYNATGPARLMTMADQLEGIRNAVSGGGKGTTARFTWVAADFLATHQVRPWSEMTTWVPRDGEDGGIGQISNARALARGLTFRPLPVTASDTLQWWRALPADRQQTLRAGLPPDREQAVLAAWRAAGHGG
jgi:2'-hydroxyisoflavone reductase